MQTKVPRRRISIPTSADTSRFQKWLGLSRSVTLLSVKDVAELIVVERIMLRVARKGCRGILVQAISIDTGVRARKIGPPGLVYRACCEGIVKRHGQQSPLHDGGQQEDTPGAPTSPAKSDSEACGEEKAAGGLDAHHGNTQAPDVPETVGHGDLRYVLDSCKDGGQDAVENGPTAQIRGQNKREDGGENYSDHDMNDDNSSDHDSSVPLGFSLGLFKFLFGECGIGISEEDEKEHKYEGKAGPLHAELYDAQDAGNTLEGLEFFAATSIMDAPGQGEDVGKARSCRGGTE